MTQFRIIKNKKIQLSEKQKRDFLKEIKAANPELLNGFKNPYISYLRNIGPEEFSEEDIKNGIIMRTEFALGEKTK